MDGRIKKRLDIGIGEFILVILIALEIMEFSGFLPADLDYIKKILSWLALGYLLYKANITEIIFGYKDKLIDAMLILAYFMLVMKNFILYSKIAVEKIGETGFSFLTPLYTFILDNAFSFGVITFYMGGIMIILLAIFNLLINTDIKKPSIMAIFFREGPPETAWQKISRAAASFMIYSAFFVMVFNLVMEWLAWAVDSTLVVLAIFFYIFFFMKHFRKLDPESVLYKIGDVGEDFYGRFMGLLRSKDTILLGISGLLVLHLLTDFGSFILPYMMGKKIDYFVALGAGHTPIPQLLSIDMGIAGSTALKMAVILLYFFNIAAALFLFIGPSFIWYEMHKKERVEISNLVYGLFLASSFVFLVSPIFKIQRLGMGAEGLYGVDILTRTITVANSIFIMSIALVLAMILTILCRNSAIKQILKYISIFLIEAFFAYYIYLFFADIAGFYAASFALIKDYFILFYLIVFMAVTMFFYLGGIAYFIYITFVDMTKKFI